MAQAALPCLLFGTKSPQNQGKMTVEFQGGTHVNKAPPLEYFTDVLAPTLRRFGANMEVVVKRKYGCYVTKLTK